MFVLEVFKGNHQKRPSLFCEGQSVFSCLGEPIILAGSPKNRNTRMGGLDPKSLTPELDPKGSAEKPRAPKSDSLESVSKSKRTEISRDGNPVESALRGTWHRLASATGGFRRKPRVPYTQTSGRLEFRDWLMKVPGVFPTNMTNLGFPPKKCESPQQKQEGVDMGVLLFFRGPRPQKNMLVFLLVSFLKPPKKGGGAPNKTSHTRPQLQNFAL